MPLHCHGCVNGSRDVGVCGCCGVLNADDRRTEERINHRMIRTNLSSSDETDLTEFCPLDSMQN